MSVFKVRECTVSMGQSSSRMFAYSIQSMVFSPPAEIGYLSTEAVFVETRDHKRIACMLLSPGHAEQAGVKKDMILYSHGNAEDMGSARDFADWMSNELDCHVLLYDYVNYGRSDKGLMSEAAMYSTITAVYEYCSTDLADVYQDLFIMGRSLGTTASVYLASTLCKLPGRPYKGLILQSPIASGFRVLCPAQAYVPAPVSSMLDRVFCPVAEEIQNVNRPVFIIHGYEDRVVNIANAYCVAANVSPASVWPPLYVSAGHNDIETRHPQLMISQLEQFMHYCKTGTLKRE